MDVSKKQIKEFVMRVMCKDDAKMFFKTFLISKGKKKYPNGFYFVNI